MYYMQILAVMDCQGPGVSIRSCVGEVDLHCELAMEYLASLNLAIPNLKIHQDRIPKQMCMF